MPRRLVELSVIIIRNNEFYGNWNALMKICIFPQDACGDPVFFSCTFSELPSIIKGYVNRSCIAATRSSVRAGGKTARRST